MENKNFSSYSLYEQNVIVDATIYQLRQYLKLKEEDIQEFKKQLITDFEESYSRSQKFTKS